MYPAHRLDVESLEVQSFEISPFDEPSTDPLDTIERIDSRAAGCTEPIRVCSG